MIFTSCSWIAEDGCGNKSEIELFFKITDKKVQTLNPYFFKKTVNSISSIEKKHYILTVYDSLFFLHDNRIEKRIGLNLEPENRFVCKVKAYNKGFIVLVSDKKGYKKALLYNEDLSFFMERIPILKMGDFLLVTIQVDLYDQLAENLESDLINTISKHTNKRSLEQR